MFLLSLELTLNGSQISAQCWVVLSPDSQFINSHPSIPLALLQVSNILHARQWDEHWKHDVTQLNLKLSCGLVHGVKLGLKKTKRVWD
jgi:hypothetical protein